VDVTVAVGTYGDDTWRQLAAERAIPSAEALGVPVVHCHADTLHDARNDALAQVTTEWVCHLDADDELEPGYFDAMTRATGDVLAPAVRYVYANGIKRSPRMPRVAGHHHRCHTGCLPQGNWLIVGSLVRTDMATGVGGWRDFTWSEDWDLWLRCYLAGASFTPVPGAIYRAHVRTDSRNRSVQGEERLAAHRAIAEANGVAV
jgi:glycosyltransferase involved in cell wall biosynthesis